MSEVAEKLKIMVVDTSTAMLHVLKNFSDKQGYESECFSDPIEACAALNKRYAKLDADYRCVLLGWPEGSSNIVDDLIKSLASADHQDLPLLIVCQEISTEIKIIVKRRPRTQVLLWKDYQQAAKQIDRLALAPIAGLGEKKPEHTTAAQTIAPDTVANSKATLPVATLPTATPSTATLPIASTRVEIKTLLLDSAPSVSHALRDKMEANGYRVTLAGSIAEGRKALEKREFDLVVTDFFLRGEEGEEFCRYLQSVENLPGHKPVCVVISSKHSEAIVKRALSVGAISCFFKNESIELLFARIDALAKALPAFKPALAADDAVAEMLELANDPAVLMDHEGVITGLNKKARRLLDDINRRELVGRDFSRVVFKHSIVLEETREAEFLTSSGSRIAVFYMAQHVSTKGTDSGVLLTFNPQPVQLDKATMDSAVVVPEHSEVSNLPATVANEDIASIDTAEVAEQVDVKALARLESQTENITPDVIALDSEKAEPVPGAAGKNIQSNPVDGFNDALKHAIAGGSSGPRRCVLMFDIQLIAATGDRISLGHSEPMLEIVNEALAKLYTREKSFAYLGNGQFGFVLSNKRMQDALVLTQKILRAIPKLVKYLNNMSLVSHGAVLQLSDDTPHDIDEVLNKCRRGCNRARKDKRDNAVLVMPMNKYLSAKSTQKRKELQEPVSAE